jgi:hypothetical protein
MPILVCQAKFAQNHMLADSLFFSNVSSQSFVRKPGTLHQSELYRFLWTQRPLRETLLRKEQPKFERQALPAPLVPH